MINPFRGYVATKDKKPIQKFKDVDGLLTLEEANRLEEYAGVLNGEFTVMDIDDGKEAEKIIRLVNALRYNCRMYKTTRGVHVVFKSSKYGNKGGVHLNNSLGVTMDLRAGKNMYIVLKNNGKLRTILKDFDETRPVDEFPKIFMPIKSDYKFTDMAEGDGRNGKLFKYIITLARCGFTQEESTRIIHLINEYILDEPLPDNEIATICRNEAFSKVMDELKLDEFEGALKPKDFNDVGMAELFSKIYGEEIKYSSATGWIVWTGQKWEINDLKGTSKYIEFLNKCITFAKKAVASAYDTMEPEVDETTGLPKKFKKSGDIEKAEKYLYFLNSMCSNHKINGVLNIAKSFLEIDVKDLDKNQFELNTPNGIINLKSGLVRPHDPKAMCTKMTMVGPSGDGKELWDELLNTVTQNDEEYKEFLQYVSGSILIGSVYNEALIIAHGEGRNGKSTLFNTMYKILNDYSGKIPAESLTTRVKNSKVDLAELLGKRFILASETEEGQRFSNSMLKQIASTDPISAEKKYHDPFTFEPSHTALLYTNFLPRMGSLDAGTKRRIIICPFNAVISKPKKDYAEKLLEKSGGAILSWMLEGAKKFIEAEYQMPPCKVATDAREEYFKENDWLGQFISDCCVVGKTEKAAGGQLYRTYRTWANDIGDYPRRNNDFAEALKRAGYTSKRTEKGIFWDGISIDPESPIGKKASEEFI